MTEKVVVIQSSKDVRNHIAAAVEVLIDILDDFDGDADFEPNADLEPEPLEDNEVMRRDLRPARRLRRRR